MRLALQLKGFPQMGIDSAPVRCYTKEDKKKLHDVGYTHLALLNK